MSGDLKKGWQRWRFDQMAQHVNERIDNPGEADVDRYVGLEHLDSESLRIRRWGSPKDVESTKLLFRTGDIIFGKRRAYQRKLGVADFDGICSAHAMVLRANSEVVLPEFLPFFMQGDLFMERAIEISVGSLSPTINWKALASEEFALPPLEEQARIVNVLRTYDNTSESLLHGLDAAQSLRKSLLEEVFTARDGDDDYVTLGQLGDRGIISIQTGPFGTVLSASEYTSTGWPVINPVNITDGKILEVDAPRVSDATADRLEKYRMNAGDILMIRKGEIGTAVLIGPQEAGWIAGSDTIVLRANDEIIAPGYLLYFLLAPTTHRVLRSFAHGTIMPGLNERMLDRLAIPLESIASQLDSVMVLQRLDENIHSMRTRSEQIKRFRLVVLREVFGVQGEE